LKIYEFAEINIDMEFQIYGHMQLGKTADVLLVNLFFLFGVDILLLMVARFPNLDVELIITPIPATPQEREAQNIKC
jgi:hypothetical protein